MKKLICLVLSMLLCLSGFALGEEDGNTNEIFLEYPELGFNLRLPNKYIDHVKGLISLNMALALDSESNYLQILSGAKPAKTADVGLFALTYIGLTEEEYNANAKSSDAEAQSRNLEAEVPFITLFIVKDSLTMEDVERIVCSAVDMSTMEVQVKADGYTFYKDTSAATTEFSDPAYAEEYAELMSHVDEILDGCDYYAPYNPYAEKSGMKLSFETTDLDGSPIDSAELFGRHEYTLLNIWGTWCGPCIGELAELDALNNRLASLDCGVVGLLEDATKNSNADKAKDIMAEKGAHYLCIEASEGLLDLLSIQYFPTTYVVDRSGTVVGDAIVGAYVAAYEEAITNLLNTQNVETEEVSDQEDKPAYTVRVVDQNGAPVPEATVGFCLDTGCFPVETDENGVAVFSGAPARYHIQVVDAPDEYDDPDDTDCYIGPESGEMTLVITKK